MSGLGSHNQSNVATIYYKPAKKNITNIIIQSLTAQSQFKRNNNYNNNFHCLPHTHNEQNCWVNYLVPTWNLNNKSLVLQKTGIEICILYRFQTTKKPFFTVENIKTKQTHFAFLHLKLFKILKNQDIRGGERTSTFTLKTKL